MKILILNYSDNNGGAAIASHRLFSLLKQCGIDISFEVLEKKTTDSIQSLFTKTPFFDNIILIRLMKKIILRIILYTKKKLRLDFKTSNIFLHSQNKKNSIDLDKINTSDYDIIHFHWINHDMFSIEAIAKIIKPIVWTMHDSWPFCGAEHHPDILENDIRFIQGYTKNNKPKTTFGPDICRKTWERKKKAWNETKFNFIAPSNYLKDCFDKSALFKDSKSPCIVIPNIVPEKIFRPLDKNNLKEQYQIPLHKKVIGFGAAYDITEEKSSKGGHILLSVLKKITDESNYHFVIFGNANVAFLEAIKIPTFNAGFISNPYILAGIYNLCNVVVCPSLIENLPNICLESLFCGIPVAAFDTGGIPDIVEHKNTGYLAKCFDTIDMNNGIMYCINNYNELSKNSLKKAHTDFNNKLIYKKHIELYESVLREHKGHCK